MVESVSMAGFYAGMHRISECSLAGHTLVTIYKFILSCKIGFPAATFGHENITTGLVTVNVFAVAKRAVRNIVDISMFIRTRQTRGAIFYLGSMPGMVTFSEETHIAAELEGGELLVRIQFNATPESYTVGGVKLDDGHNHLIQVNLGFVSLRLFLKV